MVAYEIPRVPHVVFGSGTSAEIGQRMKSYCVTKCLIVTDPMLVKIGLVEPIKKSFADAGIECEVYDRVIPEPPDTGAIDCAVVIRDGGFDGVLAFGGGSSIDTAKAGTLIANFPEIPKAEELYDYRAASGNLLEGTGKMSLALDRAAKFFAIPTTAGTGSEGTASAVLTDSTRNLKFSFANENLMPDFTIIDPALTLGIPARGTANAAIDALGHTIEDLIGMGQNEFSGMVHLRCLEKIWKWLPVALREPKNLEARENLAWAAHNCECCGAVPNGHAVAHAIGAMYHIVHGHSVAMVLPAAIRYFAEYSQTAIANIADVIGVPVTDDAHETAGRVADAVRDFCKASGLCMLSEYMEQNGIEDDLDTIVEKAYPIVFIDYKATRWMPPLHTGDSKAKLKEVIKMMLED